MKKNTLLTLTICAAMTAASLTAFAADKDTNLIAPAPAADDVIVGVPQITVDGAAVDFNQSHLSQYLFETNGNTMVPVRAVAEKMGFTVGWDGENNAVTVGDDSWEVMAYIGDDLYTGVTKIEGAVGMTAPQSYGAAPVLFEDCTFVPAKMFELLDYSYHAVGEFVDFKKNADTVTDTDGQEYSSNTLIVSVSSDASEAEIADLFRANDLEVIYHMENLHMYAVKLPAPAAIEALDALAAKLSENKAVLSVSKDAILHLDDSAQIPNPFIPYETLDAAKEALSFQPSVPGRIPTGYEINEITVANGELLQIVYENRAGETIFYRTAIGDADISGDYNTYPQTERAVVKGRTVTMKGSDGRFHNAGWLEDGKAFSIYSEAGMEKDDLLTLIQSI